ncbi:MAG: GNAT family N-acetyltransferase [Patescibacteria group bacterium]
MKIIINYATKNDIDKLIEVYSEWKKLKGKLPAELIKIDNYEDLTKYFDGSNKTREYLLATDENGQAVATCYIDTAFLGLMNIRLGDMMVKEKYRKQGIGSKLVDKVIEFARQNNCGKIWLWTQEELVPAVNLYKKKGFVWEGTIKQQFCRKDAQLYGLILR